MHLAKNIALLQGLTGGVILGLSSTSFLYLTGRITGISGFVENSLITTDSEESAWPVSYLAGLISSGVLLSSVYPEAFGDGVDSRISCTYLIVAGTLTGFGTRLGSGCTSGHGLCGLARFSLRSLVAVCTFMTTGALSSYLSRDTLLRDSIYLASGVPRNFNALPMVAFFSGLAIFFKRKSIFSFLSSKRSLFSCVFDNLVSYSSGILFGISLGISGMCDPSRVLHFLDFSGSSGWDYTLMGVMGGGVLVNMIGFNALKCSGLVSPYGTKVNKFCECIHTGSDPANTVINWKLVLGSALFGLGWGLAGVCPGPGLVSMGAQANYTTYFIPSMLAGIGLYELVFGGKPSKPEKKN